MSENGALPLLRLLLLPILRQQNRWAQAGVDEGPASAPVEQLWGCLLFQSLLLLLNGRRGGLVRRRGGH